MEQVEVRVKYFHQDVKDLRFIEQGDWIDLSAYSIKRYDSDQPIPIIEGYRYKEGESFLIGLGVAIQLPVLYEAVMVPRSSTFKKYKLIQTNGMGVIDNSYCGDNDQWWMPVYAFRRGDICRGDRIAQFRIQPRMRAINNVIFNSVGALGDSRGGLGSTGR